MLCGLGVRKEVRGFHGTLDRAGIKLAGKLGPGSDRDGCVFPWVGDHSCKLAVG